MAFPVNGIIDNFNRSNQSPPGPLWSAGQIQGGASILNVTSNQLAAASDGNNYLTADYGPDQEIYCTVATKPATGQYVGLFMRVQQAGTSTWDGYALIWVVGSTNDDYSIRRYDNGTSVPLLVPASTTLAPGEKIGMQLVGNTLRAYKTVAGVWEQVGGDVVDATYTSAGKMGIELSTSSIRVDDFGGGTLSASLIPVNTVAPVVTGTAQEGQVLSCTTGTWTNSPTSYGYVWRRADISQTITGATASTYTLTGADVGHTILCQVTATNGSGDSSPANSNTSSVVTGPNPDTLVRVSGAWVATTRRVRVSGAWVIS